MKLLLDFLEAHAWVFGVVYIVNVMAFLRGCQYIAGGIANIGNAIQGLGRRRD